MHTHFMEQQVIINITTLIISINTHDDDYPGLRIESLKSQYINRCFYCIKGTMFAKSFSSYDPLCIYYFISFVSIISSELLNNY